MSQYIATNGLLTLNPNWYLAREWLIYKIIDNNFPNGIKENELVDYLVQASVKLKTILRWPPEYHPKELLEIWVSQGYVDIHEEKEEQEKYSTNKKGRQEMQRLEEKYDLEQVLDYGNWNDVCEKIKQ